MLRDKDNMVEPDGIEPSTSTMPLSGTQSPERPSGGAFRPNRAHHRSDPFEDNAALSGTYRDRRPEHRQDVGMDPEPLKVRHPPRLVELRYVLMGIIAACVAGLALVALSGCASQPSDPLIQAQNRLMSQCIQNFPPGWETSKVMSTCKSRVNGQIQQVRAEIDATAI